MIATTRQAANTICVVEDDPSLREVLSLLLEDEGCQVTAFPTAEDALAAIEGGAKYSLVIADLMLGAGASGYDLCLRARPSLPSAGFLIMSGHFMQLRDYTDSDGMRFMRKPLDFDDLLGHVRSLLN